MLERRSNQKPFLRSGMFGFNRFGKSGRDYSRIVISSNGMAAGGFGDIFGPGGHGCDFEAALEGLQTLDPSVAAFVDRPLIRLLLLDSLSVGYQR